MEQEQREAFLKAITDSVRLYFNNNYVPFQSCKVKYNMRDHDLTLVGHEHVIIKGFGDDEGKVVALNELDDDAIGLIMQMVNYSIIRQTSSIVIPVENDGFEFLETGKTHCFHLYSIDFDMTFEEYQEAEEVDVMDLVDTYDTFAEALVQQKNMVT